MARLRISDAQGSLWWLELKSQGVYETKTLRLRVEGMLWRVRTGAPWRDMPVEFGSWKSIYNPFNRWSKRGIWQKIFVGKIPVRTGQRVELYGCHR